MSKEEEKMNEWSRIEEIVDAIYKNQQKFGYFELRLKYNSIIYGTQFSITYYNSYSKEFFVVIEKNNTVYAKIRDKSIKYIGPEIYVVGKESDKND